MTLTPCLSDIVGRFSQVIVFMYLRSCLNHLSFSLVPYCSKAINKMLKKMVASMIQK